jgi:hypothetical protein
MPWRKAVGASSIFGAWSQRTPNGPRSLVSVAGRRPSTRKPESWCTYETAQLLVGRCENMVDRGIAVAIGGAIPAEAVLCDDPYYQQYLDLQPGWVRIGRIRIDDGYKLTQTEGGGAVEIYTDTAIKIAGHLDSAVERHLRDDGVTVLFGYAVEDEKLIEQIEPREGVRLALSGEFMVEPTTPVSATEMAELRLLDAITLAEVLVAPERLDEVLDRIKIQLTARQGEAGDTTREVEKSAVEPPAATLAETEEAAAVAPREAVAKAVADDERLPLDNQGRCQTCGLAPQPYVAGGRRMLFCVRCNLFYGEDGSPQRSRPATKLRTMDRTMSGKSRAAELREMYTPAKSTEDGSGAPPQGRPVRPGTVPPPSKTAP